MSVTRVSLRGAKLVYVIVADKKLNYAGGRSRVAYIGTTKKGITRISQSVAARAEAVLGLHGVEEFEVRVVTCRPRQRVKSWLKLERALLLCFREKFCEVPKCNSHGKRIREAGEFTLFSKARIKRILDDLS